MVVEREKKKRVWWEEFFSVDSDHRKEPLTASCRYRMGLGLPLKVNYFKSFKKMTQTFGIF